MAHSSLRFGIGRFTTEEEISYSNLRHHRHIITATSSPLFDSAVDRLHHRIPFISSSTIARYFTPLGNGTGRN